MRSVLVSHPHAAAVSVAVARALERAGRLAEFVTGIVAAPGSIAAAALGRAAQYRPQLSNRIVEGLGAGRVRSLGALELSARALALFGPASARPRRTYDTMFRLHDAAVAALRWPGAVDCVYAYEDAALRTLARAGRIGAAKVLDVPAVHWRSQERVWREESQRWPGAMAAALLEEPRWKTQRKAAELALADAVCVASAHARSTLEEAGVRTPVVVAPYGFPLGRFALDARRGDAFTVVSAGAHDLRKGTPYLLEAWKAAALKDARLRLVGPMRLSRRFISRYEGLFEHVPHVARVQMAREYGQADILVFPTLADGFGLVIQEAMCCGTPVITTPCGGGPECIDDGVEGWIVPPRDVDALVERLRWGAANRDRLAEMGRAARRRAEVYDDRAAGEILVSGLERAIASGDRGRA